jgi:hypothetical protein
VSKPQTPPPGKLIFGLIYREATLARSCWEALELLAGPWDYISAVTAFAFTGYYEKEMGAPLFRRWGCSQRLVSQDQLPAIKLKTNELESRWLLGGRRQINVDPGILSAERLVLATGKNFIHRIYLGSGVFGDLTLIYSKGSYRPLDWTYPDYRTPETIAMFNILRSRYRRQIAAPGLEPTSGEG